MASSSVACSIICSIGRQSVLAIYADSVREDAPSYVPVLLKKYTVSWQVEVPNICA